MPCYNKKLKSAGGNQRCALLNKNFCLNIRRNELITFADMTQTQTKLADVHKQLDLASEKILDLETNVLNLHSEIKTLKELIDAHTEDLELELQKSQNLLETNETLQKYVENICGISVGVSGMSGRTNSKFSTLSRSYQLRRLKEVKSRAECALWFLDMYGLKLDSLTLKDDKEEQHGINFGSLSDSEKLSLEKVLYLLDRFYVSDACYHELSVVCDGLPKSYLIKQLRSDMNALCHIQMTPGPNEGAEIDAEQELAYAIRSFFVRHPELKQSEKKPSFHVKFCGDGTNVSRKTGMCVMSFSLFSPDISENVSSPHHAVAVVKGHESYDMNRVSFSNIWKAINTLHDRGTVDIDGESYGLKVFLAADYKFLLLVLGMSGATSNHACVYCKIHRCDRWDMSKTYDFYTSPDMVRTVENMMSCSLTNSMGCKNLSLVGLPIQHIIVDELHMMLRITDRLTDNLIQECLDLDLKEKIGALTKSIDNPESHLNSLVNAVRTCGVSFKVWETRDGNGRGTGHFEYSSLVGEEKKKLLKLLPQTLLEKHILHAETEDMVAKIWAEFANVYATISSNFDGVSEDALFTQVKNWVLLFLPLEGKRKGYERARITPYMHILVYHVPNLCMLYSGLRNFSAQGMEKLNDVVKSIHRQHSNKIGACSDVVIAPWRQNQLTAQKRAPNKTNDEYWQKNIFAKRKRVDIDVSCPVIATASSSVDSMSANDIKKS